MSETRKNGGATIERIESVADEKKKVKAQQDAQEKYRITLPQNPPDQPQKPDKFVQINGYGYQIKRNKPVEVPENVYLVLVQTGEIPPQKEEHEQYVPRMTYLPGEAISKQTPANAQ